MADRMLKPLYFHKRWKSAVGGKRDYYRKRLVDMGIDPDTSDIITCSGDIATVGLRISGDIIHIQRVNWRKGIIVS